MDDAGDDARYPPNQRRHFPSPHNPNPRFLSPIDPRYPDEDDPEDLDRSVDEANSGSDSNSSSSSSSSQSRGKRRRLDKLALGFEFAPRAPAPSARPPASTPPAPPARGSPAEWSEESTFVLLDAWGDCYVQNGRKSLRADEWSEVAKKVSQSSRTGRSEAQCRNRLDTLKRKYRKEKAWMADAVNSASKWVYFSKMDSLMASPSPPPPAPAPAPAPPRPSVFMSRSNGRGPADPVTDEDEEEEEDDSDGLPPKIAKGFRDSGSESFRMLADSIKRFGKIYERMEKNKRQQMAELEMMRKEFQRDLEVHKRQILERAQVELAKIRQDEEDDEEEEEADDGEDVSAG